MPEPDTASAGRADTADAASHPFRRRRALVAAGLVGLTLLFVLLALVVVRAGSALPGTSIAGIDVSGYDRDALANVVTGLVAQRQEAEVAVSVVDRSYTFVPGSDGYGADVDATVRDALRAGRFGPLGMLGHVAATFGATRDVAIAGTPLEAAIERFVAEVADEVDQDLHVGDVRVDPDTFEVATTAPRHRVTVDRAGSVAALTAVVGLPDPPPVAFPAEIEAPPTDDDALADAVARAERAVAGPLRLTAEGGEATLSRSALARILRTEEQDGRLVLVADRDELDDVITPHLPNLEVQPRSAMFEVVSGLSQFDEMGDATWTQRPAELRIVPSTPGHLWDAESGAPQVSAVLEAGDRDARLDLVVTPADLTTEQAEDLDITHLIGTFTTRHPCCANRVTNIQRMADLVRGTVLRPGDRFSINDHVGQRTTAKGFLEDGAIFDGELRQEVGGGVSQFATTMYNAAFFAGIEIVQHKAHSLYISRYPLGREATLSYPSVDLIIRNDTSNGIFIHTSYTSTSITVSLFGNTNGRTVRAVMGEPTNFRDFSTRERTNRSLPEGTRRVVQQGTRGYQVLVQRILSGGGDDRTEQIRTTYQPRPQVVEIGTGPPRPSPTPTPTSDPSPTPGPSPDPDDEDDG